MKLVLIFCSLLVSNSLSERLDYTGYELIKAFGSSVDDLIFLQQEETPSKLVLWDFGEGEGDWGVSLIFHVHPELAASVKEKLSDRKLAFRVQVSDLGREIARETEENARAQAKPDDEFFDSYHTFEDNMAWVEEQALACGSACTTFSIGNSYQGRELKVIKMTGAANGCTEKPAIWIDAGIHAREWIAHTTGLYLIDRMIQEYGSDPLVTQMRDAYDWYFMPTVNPDGYVYTWESDRLWRKTRQPNEGSVCVGADANRNYDFMWMTIGASSSPCSDTFAGSSPHSEPETQAQADFMMTMDGSWEMFITLHTYSQLWMSPWGYTEEEPEDYPEMARVGQAAVDAIFATHGEVYRMGNAASILYESSGTSRDWAKGVPAIPYVYTIELRSLDSFVLPPTEIRPTGEEIWAALKASVESIWQVRPPHCISA